jgi:hypothetical protein
MERVMGIETTPKSWEIWRASPQHKSIPQCEKQGPKEQGNNPRWVSQIVARE